MNHIIIYDHMQAGWLSFRDPLEVITARAPGDVISALQRLDQAVQSDNIFAAGWICYEAAPAFDPALRVRGPGKVPLLCFGLFPSYTRLNRLPIGNTSYKVGEWTADISRDIYDDAVDRIRQYLADGHTFQVNYTHRLHADFKGSAVSYFQDLHQAQMGRFGVYADTDDFAVCSVSPELFFTLEGPCLRSRPMKGTCRRGRFFMEDVQYRKRLMISEKERAENLMIVDMVRNDMGRIAETGTVCVEQLFITEQYPTVWQMTSTICAETRVSIPEIFGAMFPFASVTGAPKPRTMEIIAELEASPRGIYTGTLGYWGRGRNAQFNVAIRTVTIDKKANRAEYGVGGGIVWDSDPGREYLECGVKAGVLTLRRPAFSLNEAILWTPEQGFFLLDYHMRRMIRSAAYFQYPFNVDEIENALKASTDSLQGESHKIRLMLHHDGSFDIEPVAVSSIPVTDPCRIRLAASPVFSDDVFLYHKTSHRRQYDQAATGVKECDDVLFWNEQGEVTEFTSSNAVFKIRGKMVTPPVECGLLPGTFRAWLLDRGEVEERVIAVDELRACDAVYLINSVRRWRAGILPDEPGTFGKRRFKKMAP